MTQHQDGAGPALLEVGVEDPTTPQRAAARTRRRMRLVWPLVGLVGGVLALLTGWAVLQPPMVDEPVDTPRIYTDHDSWIPRQPGDVEPSVPNVTGTGPGLESLAPTGPGSFGAADTGYVDPWIRAKQAELEAQGRRHGTADGNDPIPHAEHLDPWARRKLLEYEAR
jgi:hypothetical protein